MSPFFLIWLYRHARLATQQGAFSSSSASAFSSSSACRGVLYTVNRCQPPPSCNQCTIAVVTTTYDTRYPLPVGFYGRCPPRRRIFPGGDSSFSGRRRRYFSARSFDRVTSGNRSCDSDEAFRRKRRSMRERIILCRLSQISECSREI